MNGRRLLALFRAYDAELKYWPLSSLRKALSAEHPEWSASQVEAAAQAVFLGLRELDREWYNAQRRFFRHNNLRSNPWR